MRSRVIISLLACVSVFAIGACASIEKNPNTAKLATQYAVLKFAEQSSPDKRAGRLENVRKIAEDVKAIASNEAATVSFLRDTVAEQVARLKLSSADQLLAN